jgi:hypothetical protein
MKRNEIITVQGRQLTSDHIGEIKSLMAANPSWHRTRLSRELCERWSWYRSDGTPKDMSCRCLLLKLERRGLLKLPERAAKAYNHRRGRLVPDIPHSTAAVETNLASLKPLGIFDVRRSGRDEELFNCLLTNYHYLGLKTTVGEYMKYLVVDRSDRPLGCVLFGAAAWKAKARDEYIGWSIPEREKNLNYLTNNTRFLILPWVRVPHLASHILGQALRRLNNDWRKRYAHEVCLVETFVDRSRFMGTCYRAANWRKVGETVGRSRQDRHHKIRVPVKDVYVYPLRKNFRETLCR